MHTANHARRTITIAAAIVGLLATACGVQGDDPLSKPEFVAQANSICQASNDELDVIFEAIYADFDEADWDDPANQLLIFKRWDEAMVQAGPVIEQQLDELGDLEPPTGDKELVESLLADQAAAVAEFTSLIEAAAEGDQAALAALDTDEDPFDDIDRRAREYGLTVCGESG